MKDIKARGVGEERASTLLASASMNFEIISDSLRSKFPNIKPVNRPIVDPGLEIYDLNWVSGFAEGESCFFVNIYKRKDSVLGEGVKLVFKIAQDQRNSEILIKLINIFSCGKGARGSGEERAALSRRPLVYNQSPKVKVQDFMVTGLTDLLEKIIPFFYAHPLQGAKKKEFEDAHFFSFLFIIYFIVIKKKWVSFGLCKSSRSVPPRSCLLVPRLHALVNEK